MENGDFNYQKPTIQETKVASGVLKRQIEFYREQNDRLEDIMKKLKILNDRSLPLPTSTQLALEKLIDKQEKFDCTEATAAAMSLSHAKNLRKQNNYVSKLQLCIKAYTLLNDRVTNELKLLKRDMQLNSFDKQKSFLSTTDDELKVLQAKIKRYENELVKFEVKYPWLKDPMLDLPKIGEKVGRLEKLREEKLLLLKQLEVYHDLKPDMQEARKQLAEIKRKYENQQQALFK